MHTRPVDELMQIASRSAELLYRRGARRVWVFGSLAVGRVTDERSDIDLAVEGLPGSLFSQIQNDLNQLAGRKVDLVDLSSAVPRLRPHILRTRVLLPNND